MFEGSGELDPPPPEQQQPPAGMALEQDPDNSELLQHPGTITLNAEPVVVAATDPLRPAYADRIEISTLPELNPYAELAAGRTGYRDRRGPTPAVIRRFTTDPALRTGSSTRRAP
jgi:hypothetical protein